MKDNNISRRGFLKLFGAGTVATAATLAGCKQPDKAEQQAADEYKNQVEPPMGKMTYRENPKTKEKVSLLGYGMMRLPKKPDSDEFDQDMINRQVDYAIEHGLNYFDTSPVYCQGQSEHCTGIALSRHPRDKYIVATKLSNFNRDYWKREKAIEMYHNSMKELQVDYIDYYLLHAVGGSYDEFVGRYEENGMMDYLMKEREAGRIRNLGFSFHGLKTVFDQVLALNDKYHWDFCQIELNYLDWDFANEISDRNVDASYLYAELQKRGIPAVVMEPLLGGRLFNLPQYLATELKSKAPEKSVASWAFRYAGTPEGVLTVLSGMTYMEHLKDNLLSYSPLVPLSDAIKHFIELRGIGIVNVRRLFGTGAVNESEKIDLVVKLEPWVDGKQYDRFGMTEETMNILGLSLPALTIPVKPGRNLAVIIEVAAKNNRNKRMGYNAANELTERLARQQGGL